MRPKVVFVILFRLFYGFVGGQLYCITEKLLSLLLLLCEDFSGLRIIPYLTASRHDNHSSTPHPHPTHPSLWNKYIYRWPVLHFIILECSLFCGETSGRLWSLHTSSLVHKEGSKIWSDNIMAYKFRWRDKWKSWIIYSVELFIPFLQVWKCMVTPTSCEFQVFFIVQRNFIHSTPSSTSP